MIAFSTFDQPPPANSLFGRTTVKGEQVLCTNPAALGGGAGKVDPIFPSAPFDPTSTLAAGIKQLNLTQPMPNTVWSSLPGAYQARCSSAGGANVLQISPLGGAQVPTPSPDPTWGLHLLDANIALGQPADHRQGRGGRVRQARAVARTATPDSKKPLYICRRFRYIYVP